MYEIEFVEIISENSFHLSRERYASLLQELTTEDLPEYNILDPSWLQLGTRAASTDEVLVPRFLWWHGKSTPKHLEVFLRVVLPSFNGSADIVFNIREKKTLRQRGFRLKQGKVSSHQVVLFLGSAL